MGKIRLVLSDWDEDVRAWKLPNLPGLNIEVLQNGAVHVPTERWEIDSSAGEPKVRWISNSKPPKDPCVVATFRELSLRTKLTDPTFLTPTLLFLGTLTGGLIAYQNGLITNRTSLEVARMQSQGTEAVNNLASLAIDAKGLKCNNNQEGAAAVSACLDAFKVESTSEAQLKSQLDQKGKTLDELQVAYNKLKVACQR